MIYTITLNPSIDYFVTLTEFTVGGLNRAESERIVVAGKGVNVSDALAELSMPSHSYLFTAGIIGESIEKMAKERGLSAEFIKVNGENRINVKLLHGEETEINGRGITITEQALNTLYDRLRAVNADDVIVLSGNVPVFAIADGFDRLLSAIRGTGAKAVFDMSGESLLASLTYEPFLVKPNAKELTEAFGESENACDYFDLMKRLQERGAKNVAVTLGGKGALLLTERGEKYTALCPKGEARSSVGAGDAFVAGFISAYIATEDMESALKTGVAVGSAKTFGVPLRLAKNYAVQTQLLKE